MLSQKTKFVHSGGNALYVTIGMYYYNSYFILYLRASVVLMTILSELEFIALQI